MKRSRLNRLLALQEGIGLERNEAWLGREASVLLDTISASRSHDHGHDEDAGPRLSGRTRGNKLVHVAGPTDLLGREVMVRIEHAGPYALRGALVEA